MAWTNAALFSLAIVLIAVGLVGIGAWLRQRAPKLSIAAMLIATFAFATNAVNFVLLLGVTGQSAYIGTLAGLGVVSSLLSTTLLGVAALRTRAFNRAINWTLVSVGLVTFPVILLTIPLESVLPAYVISDLALHSAATDWKDASATERPVCPACDASLVLRGKRPRQLKTYGGQALALDRSYGVCPHCHQGFFPPR